eukprot:g6229.t1
MKVWIGLLLLAVAANALEIDLVCNQTKRKGVCDREVVSAGFLHTCGVTSEGLIECFGKDDFGQCNGHRPKKASQGTFVQVSAGFRNTCGVTSEGLIECFGLDFNGQSNGHKPKQASKGRFVQVSVGRQDTCGLTSEGHIECLGHVTSGQKPKQASKGRFVQVTVGTRAFPWFICGLTSEGLIECFGKDGSKVKQASKGKFVQVSMDKLGYNLCGLTNKGHIECFGYAGKVMLKQSFEQISAISKGACGLKKLYDGGHSIKCVHNSTSSLRDKYAQKGSFVQVSVGWYHFCGLTSEGMIECFGFNGFSNRYRQSNGFKPYNLRAYQQPGYGRTYDGKTRKCLGNFYSKGGRGAICLPCEVGYVSNSGSSQCKKGIVINDIIKRLESQKEKTNDLSIKNSRLWQKEQIRLQHDKMMQQRKKQDDANEKSSCEAQSLKGTIIFPAIEISNEIEKIEDTTCIDTNRDELLKSFCSFTSDLDNLFQIQNFDKEAKSFWPNICCKERRDTTLEVCEDPTGTISRTDIVPFALSQGGNYSRHNLYVEVTEAIKEKGYLHEGMKKLLESFPSSADTENAKKNVDTFFNEVSLCGPRIVDAPGAKEKTKLCELFVPYKRAMANFYTLIESLFVTPITPQSSFLETMERSLRKRSETARVGKNNIQQMMQMKPKATAQATCTGGSKWVSSALKQEKKLFCRGYNHLDLSGDTNIRNVAVYYLKNDITYNNTEMLRLSKQLRYQVTDDSCPSPLFEAKDISIQQVAMDALGSTKEWVAVVNLNTQDENGYLQSELQDCEARDYLIGAKVTIEVFEDNRGCCPGLKDFKKCKQLVVRDSCKKPFDSKKQCEEYNTRQKCGDNLPKITVTAWQVSLLNV